MGLEDGRELERQQCCGLDMVDVRRIFLEAIEAKSLNEEKKINGKKKSFREWLYFIGKQVDYEFWEGGRGGKRKIIVNKKNISWLIEEVKKEVSNDDLVLGFLKPFSENFNRQDKYKPNLLRCLLSKCKNWMEAFGKFKSIIKKVSKNPGIVDHWIEHPTENPLNEEIKIGKATYSMAQWILFFLHLAGFETYLSGLWKALEDNWQEAVSRLDSLFGQIYWDSKVEQVRDAMAPEIAEAVGDTSPSSEKMDPDEELGGGDEQWPNAPEEWMSLPEVEPVSEIVEPIDDFSPREGNQQIEEPHNEKEENQPPPILIIPLIWPDPLLHFREIEKGFVIRRDKETWKLLFERPEESFSIGENIVWILMYNILESKWSWFLLEWISGQGADKRMKEEMLKSGYAMLEDGRFVWEAYLEDVEKYFNFAPWWNKLLKEVMGWLTLWKKYLIFVNLYLIWNLWWEKSPHEREKEFNERGKNFKSQITNFLRKSLSLRAWEVLTWLERNFGEEKAKALVERQPSLLARKIAILEAAWSWLEDKFGEEKAKALVERQPSLLAARVASLEATWNWLVGKFGEEGAKALVEKGPSILYVDRKSLEQRWAFLEQNLWKDEAKQLIREYPIVLTLKDLGSKCSPNLPSDELEKCIKIYIYNIINSRKKTSKPSS